MSPFAVTASAVLMRSLSIIFGLVVARLSGIDAYSDYVLALSLFNMVASVFQLGLVPQIIRSDGTSEWGDFLRSVAPFTIVVYAPVACIVMLVEPVLRANLGVSIFAASSAFGLLAGTTAGALQCRSRRFVEFFGYSCTFFALCVAPVFLGMFLESTFDALLVISGAWMALVGLAWLVAVMKQEHAHENAMARDWTTWRDYFRDAASSAAFGLVVAFGFYAVNRSAVLIDDGNSRATIALGVQVLSVVIFIPGALSSYLVPTLRFEAASTAVRRLVLKSAVAYLAIGSMVAAALWVLRPSLEVLYGLRIAGADLVAFAVLLAASVVAASNAIFNQLFVAWRRFGHQLLLALLWLVTLIVGLLVADGEPVAIGSGLLVAYIALACASLALVWRGRMPGLTPLQVTNRTQERRTE